MAGIEDRLSRRRVILDGGGHRQQQQWNRRRQRQWDCGQGSRRLGITVLWPPRQLLKGNGPALDSSTPRLRCAEADEMNWAVSASLGTLQMIEADYPFDVNFA